MSLHNGVCREIRTWQATSEWVHYVWNHTWDAGCKQSGTWKIRESRSSTMTYLAEGGQMVWKRSKGGCFPRKQDNWRPCKDWIPGTPHQPPLKKPLRWETQCRSGNLTRLSCSWFSLPLIITFWYAEYPHRNQKDFGTQSVFCMESLIALFTSVQARNTLPLSDKSRNNNFFLCKSAVYAWLYVMRGVVWDDTLPLWFWYI